MNHFINIIIYNYPWTLINMKKYYISIEINKTVGNLRTDTLQKGIKIIKCLRKKSNKGLKGLYTK